MADRASYNRFAVIEGGAVRLGNPVDVPSLSGGGGDGTSGDMEARVSKLETDMRAIGEALVRIETKLDAKASAVDVGRVEGKLDAKASAADLGTLSGKLDDRPTTWKVVTIVIGLGVLLSGSQLIRTVVDAFHSAPAQTTKAP